MKAIQWAIAAAVLATTVVLGAWVAAPKNVDYYYLSHGSTPSNVAVCVYAHWTWHMDEISFCTDDTKRALDFVATANSTLRRN